MYYVLEAEAPEAAIFPAASAHVGPRLSPQGTRGLGHPALAKRSYPRKQQGASVSHSPPPRVYQELGLTMTLDTIFVNMKLIFQNWIFEILIADSDSSKKSIN